MPETLIAVGLGTSIFMSLGIEKFIVWEYPRNNSKILPFWLALYPTPFNSNSFEKPLLTPTTTLKILDLVSHLI